MADDHITGAVESVHLSAASRLAKDRSKLRLTAATDRHSDAMRPLRMTSTAHQHTERLLIEYNGGLKVNSSLLSVVLHD